MSSYTTPVSATSSTTQPHINSDAFEHINDIQAELTGEENNTKKGEDPIQDQDPHQRRKKRNKKRRDRNKPTQHTAQNHSQTNPLSAQIKSTHSTSTRTHNQQRKVSPPPSSLPTSAPTAGLSASTSSALASSLSSFSDYPDDDFGVYNDTVQGIDYDYDDLKSNGTNKVLTRQQQQQQQQHSQRSPQNTQKDSKSSSPQTTHPNTPTHPMQFTTSLHDNRAKKTINHDSPWYYDQHTFFKLHFDPETNSYMQLFFDPDSPDSILSTNLKDHLLRERNGPIYDNYLFQNEEKMKNQNYQPLSSSSSSSSSSSPRDIQRDEFHKFDQNGIPTYGYGVHSKPIIQVPPGMEKNPHVMYYQNYYRPTEAEKMVDNLLEKMRKEREEYELEKKKQKAQFLPKIRLVKLPVEENTSELFENHPELFGPVKPKSVYQFDADSIAKDEMYRKEREKKIKLREEQSESHLSHWKLGDRWASSSFPTDSDQFSVIDPEHRARVEHQVHIDVAPWNINKPKPEMVQIFTPQEYMQRVAFGGIPDVHRFIHSSPDGAVTLNPEDLEIFYDLATLQMQENVLVKQKEWDRKDTERKQTEFANAMHSFRVDREKFFNPDTNELNIGKSPPDDPTLPFNRALYDNLTYNQQLELIVKDREEMFPFLSELDKRAVLPELYLHETEIDPKSIPEYREQSIRLLKQLISPELIRNDLFVATNEQRMARQLPPMSIEQFHEIFLRADDFRAQREKLEKFTEIRERMGAYDLGEGSDEPIQPLDPAKLRRISSLFLPTTEPTDESEIVNHWIEFIRHGGLDFLFQQEIDSTQKYYQSPDPDSVFGPKYPPYRLIERDPNHEINVLADIAAGNRRVDGEYWHESWETDQPPNGSDLVFVDGMIFTPNKQKVGRNLEHFTTPASSLKEMMEEKKRVKEMELELWERGKEGYNDIITKKIEYLISEAEKAGFPPSDKSSHNSKKPSLRSRQSHRVDWVDWTDMKGDEFQDWLGADPRNYQQYVRDTELTSLPGAVRKIQARKMLEHDETVNIGMFDKTRKNGLNRRKGKTKIKKFGDFVEDDGEENKDNLFNNERFLAQKQFIQKAAENFYKIVPRFEHPWVLEEEFYKSLKLPLPNTLTEKIQSYFDDISQWERLHGGYDKIQNQKRKKKTTHNKHLLPPSSKIFPKIDQRGQFFAKLGFESSYAGDIRDHFYGNVIPTSNNSFSKFSSNQHLNPDKISHPIPLSELPPDSTRTAISDHFGPDDWIDIATFSKSSRDRLDDRHGRLMRIYKDKVKEYYNAVGVFLQSDEGKMLRDDFDQSNNALRIKVVAENPPPEFVAFYTDIHPPDPKLVDKIEQYERDLYLVQNDVELDPKDVEARVQILIRLRDKAYDEIEKRLKILSNQSEELAQKLEDLDKHSYHESDNDAFNISDVPKHGRDRAISLGAKLNRLKNENMGGSETDSTDTDTDYDDNDDKNDSSLKSQYTTDEIKNMSFEQFQKIIKSQKQDLIKQIIPFSPIERDIFFGNLKTQPNNNHAGKRDTQKRLPQISPSFNNYQELVSNLVSTSINEQPELILAQREEKNKKLFQERRAKQLKSRQSLLNQMDSPTISSIKLPPAMLPYETPAQTRSRLHAEHGQNENETNEDETNEDEDEDDNITMDDVLSHPALATQPASLLRKLGLKIPQQQYIDALIPRTDSRFSAFRHIPSHWVYDSYYRKFVPNYFDVDMTSWPQNWAEIEVASWLDPPLGAELQTLSLDYAANDPRRHAVDRVLNDVSQEGIDAITQVYFPEAFRKQQMSISDELIDDAKRLDLSPDEYSDYIRGMKFEQDRIANVDSNFDHSWGTLPDTKRIFKEIKDDYGIEHKYLNLEKITDEDYEEHEARDTISVIIPDRSMGTEEFQRYRDPTGTNMGETFPGYGLSKPLDPTDPNEAERAFMKRVEKSYSPLNLVERALYNRAVSMVKQTNAYVPRGLNVQELQYIGSHYVDENVGPKEDWIMAELERSLQEDNLSPIQVFCRSEWKRRFEGMYQRSPNVDYQHKALFEKKIASVSEQFHYTIFDEEKKEFVRTAGQRWDYTPMEFPKWEGPKAPFLFMGSAGSFSQQQHAIHTEFYRKKRDAMRLRIKERAEKEEIFRRKKQEWDKINAYYDEQQAIGIILTEDDLRSLGMLDKLMELDEYERKTADQRRVLATTKPLDPHSMTFTDNDLFTSNPLVYHQYKSLLLARMGEEHRFRSPEELLPKLDAGKINLNSLTNAELIAVKELLVHRKLQRGHYDDGYEDSPNTQLAKLVRQMAYSTFGDQTPFYSDPKNPDEFALALPEPTNLDLHSLPKEARERKTREKLNVVKAVLKKDNADHAMATRIQKAIRDQSKFDITRHKSIDGLLKTDYSDLDKSADRLALQYSNATYGSEQIQKADWMAKLRAHEKFKAQFSPLLQSQIPDLQPPQFIKLSYGNRYFLKPGRDGSNGIHDYLIVDQGILDEVDGVEEYLKGIDELDVIEARRKIFQAQESMAEFEGFENLSPTDQFNLVLRSNPNEFNDYNPLNFIQEYFQPLRGQIDPDKSPAAQFASLWPNEFDPHRAISEQLMDPKYKDLFLPTSFGNDVQVEPTFILDDADNIILTLMPKDIERYPIHLGQFDLPPGYTLKYQTWDNNEFELNDPRILPYIRQASELEQEYYHEDGSLVSDLELRAYVPNEWNFKHFNQLTMEGYMTLQKVSQAAKMFPNEVGEKFYYQFDRFRNHIIKNLPPAERSRIRARDAEKEFNRLKSSHNRTMEFVLKQLNNGDCDISFLSDIKPRVDYGLDAIKEDLLAQIQHWSRKLDQLEYSNRLKHEFGNEVRQLAIDVTPEVEAGIEKAINALQHLDPEQILANAQRAALDPYNLDQMLYYQPHIRDKVLSRLAWAKNLRIPRDKIPGLTFTNSAESLAKKIRSEFDAKKKNEILLKRLEKHRLLIGRERAHLVAKYKALAQKQSEWSDVTIETLRNARKLLQMVPPGMPLPDLGVFLGYNRLEFSGIYEIEGRDLNGALSADRDGNPIKKRSSWERLLDSTAKKHAHIHADFNLINDNDYIDEMFRLVDERNPGNIDRLTAVLQHKMRKREFDKLRFFSPHTPIDKLSLENLPLMSQTEFSKKYKKRVFELSPKQEAYMYATHETNEYVKRNKKLYSPAFENTPFDQTTHQSLFQFDSKRMQKKQRTLNHIIRSRFVPWIELLALKIIDPKFISLSDRPGPDMDNVYITEDGQTYYTDPKKHLWKEKNLLWEDKIRKLGYAKDPAERKSFLRGDFDGEIDTEFGKEDKMYFLDLKKKKKPKKKNKSLAQEMEQFSLSQNHRKLSANLQKLQDEMSPPNTFFEEAEQNRRKKYSKYFSRSEFDPDYPTETDVTDLSTTDDDDENDHVSIVYLNQSPAEYYLQQERSKNLRKSQKTRNSAITTTTTTTTTTTSTDEDLDEDLDEDFDEDTETDNAFPHRHLSPSEMAEKRASQYIFLKDVPGKYPKSAASLGGAFIPLGAPGVSSPTQPRTKYVMNAINTYQSSHASLHALQKQSRREKESDQFIMYDRFSYHPNVYTQDLIPYDVYTPDLTDERDPLHVPHPFMTKDPHNPQAVVYPKLNPELLKLELPFWFPESIPHNPHLVDPKDEGYDAFSDPLSHLYYRNQRYELHMQYLPYKPGPGPQIPSHAELKRVDYVEFDHINPPEQLLQQISNTPVLRPLEEYTEKYHSAYITPTQLQNEAQNDGEENYVSQRITQKEQEKAMLEGQEKSLRRVYPKHMKIFQQYDSYGKPILPGDPEFILPSTRDMIESIYHGSYIEDDYSEDMDARKPYADLLEEWTNPALLLSKPTTDEIINTSLDEEPNKYYQQNPRSDFVRSALNRPEHQSPRLRNVSPQAAKELQEKLMAMAEMGIQIRGWDYTQRNFQKKYRQILQAIVNYWSQQTPQQFAMTQGSPDEYSIDHKPHSKVLYYTLDQKLRPGSVAKPGQSFSEFANKQPRLDRVRVPASLLVLPEFDPKSMTAMVRARSDYVRSENTHIAALISAFVNHKNILRKFLGPQAFQGLPKTSGKLTQFTETDQERKIRSLTQNPYHFDPIHLKSEEREMVFISALGVKAQYKLMREVQDALNNERARLTGLYRYDNLLDPSSRSDSPEMEQFQHLLSFLSEKYRKQISDWESKMVGFLRYSYANPSSKRPVPREPPPPEPPAEFKKRLVAYKHYISLAHQIFDLQKAVKAYESAGIDEISIHQRKRSDNKRRDQKRTPQNDDNIQNYLHLKEALARQIALYFVSYRRPLPDQDSIPPQDQLRKLIKTTVQSKSNRYFRELNDWRDDIAKYADLYQKSLEKIDLRLGAALKVYQSRNDFQSTPGFKKYKAFLTSHEPTERQSQSLFLQGYELKGVDLDLIPIKERKYYLELVHHMKELQEGRFTEDESETIQNYVKHKLNKTHKLRLQAVQDRFDDVRNEMYFNGNEPVNKQFDPREPISLEEKAWNHKKYLDEFERWLDRQPDYWEALLKIAPTDPVNDPLHPDHKKWIWIEKTLKTQFGGDYDHPWYRWQYENFLADVAKREKKRKDELWNEYRSKYDELFFNYLNVQRVEAIWFHNIEMSKYMPTQIVRKSIDIERAVQKNYWEMRRFKEQISFQTANAIVVRNDAINAMEKARSEFRRSIFGTPWDMDDDGTLFDANIHVVKDGQLIKIPTGKTEKVDLLQNPLSIFSQAKKEPIDLTQSLLQNSKWNTPLHWQKLSKDIQDNVFDDRYYEYAYVPINNFPPEARPVIKEIRNIRLKAKEFEETTADEILRISFENQHLLSDLVKNRSKILAVQDQVDKLNDALNLELSELNRLILKQYRSVQDNDEDEDDELAGLIAEEGTKVLTLKPFLLDRLGRLEARLKNQIYQPDLQMLNPEKYKAENKKNTEKYTGFMSYFIPGFVQDYVDEARSKTKQVFEKQLTKEEYLSLQSSDYEIDPETGEAKPKPLSDVELQQLQFLRVLDRRTKHSAPLHPKLGSMHYLNQKYDTGQLKKGNEHKLNTWGEFTSEPIAITGFLPDRTFIPYTDQYLPDKISQRFVNDNWNTDNPYDALRDGLSIETLKDSGFFFPNYLGHKPIIDQIEYLYRTAALWGADLPYVEWFDHFVSELRQRTEDENNYQWAYDRQFLIAKEMLDVHPTGISGQEMAQRRYDWLYELFGVVRIPLSFLKGPDHQDVTIVRKDSHRMFTNRFLNVLPKRKTYSDAIGGLFKFNKNESLADMTDDGNKSARNDQILLGSDGDNDEDGLDIIILDRQLRHAMSTSPSDPMIPHLRSTINKLRLTRHLMHEKLTNDHNHLIENLSSKIEIDDSGLRADVAESIQKHEILKFKTGGNAPPSKFHSIERPDWYLKAAKLKGGQIPQLLFNEKIFSYIHNRYLETQWAKHMDLYHNINFNWITLSIGTFIPFETRNIINVIAESSRDVILAQWDRVVHSQMQWYASLFANELQKIQQPYIDAMSKSLENNHKHPNRTTPRDHYINAALGVSQHDLTQTEFERIERIFEQYSIEKLLQVPNPTLQSFYYKPLRYVSPAGPPLRFDHRGVLLDTRIPSAPLRNPVFNVDEESYANDYLQYLRIATFLDKAYHVKFNTPKPEHEYRHHTDTTDTSDSDTDLIPKKANNTENYSKNSLDKSNKFNRNIKHRNYHNKRIITTGTLQSLKAPLVPNPLNPNAIKQAQTDIRVTLSYNPPLVIHPDLFDWKNIGKKLIVLINPESQYQVPIPYDYTIVDEYGWEKDHSERFFRGAPLDFQTVFEGEFDKNRREDDYIADVKLTKIDWGREDKNAKKDSFGYKNYQYRDESDESDGEFNVSTDNTLKHAFNKHVPRYSEKFKKLQFDKIGQNDQIQSQIDDKQRSSTNAMLTGDYTSSSSPSTTISPSGGKKSPLFKKSTQTTASPDILPPTSDILPPTSDTDYFGTPITVSTPQTPNDAAHKSSITTRRNNPKFRSRLSVNDIDSMGEGKDFDPEEFNKMFLGEFSDEEIYSYNKEDRLTHYPRQNNNLNNPNTTRNRNLNVEDEYLIAQRAIGFNNNTDTDSMNEYNDGQDDYYFQSRTGKSSPSIDDDDNGSQNSQSSKSSSKSKKSKFSSKNSQKLPATYSEIESDEITPRPGYSVDYGRNFTEEEEEDEDEDESGGWWFW